MRLVDIVPPHVAVVPNPGRHVVGGPLGPYVRAMARRKRGGAEGGIAGALLHRDQWRARGVYDRALASAEFTTVYPGYQTPTDEPASFSAMSWVLQNKVLPGAVLSHTTAALHWGIPFPVQLERGVSLLRQPDLPVWKGVEVIPSIGEGRSLRSGARLPILHCRLPPGATSAVGRGVVVHRWREGPTAARNELTVSSPSEVLRELATMMPLWDVVAAIDAVIGPHFTGPEQCLEGLVAQVGRARGLRGSARLSKALAQARGNVLSPGESLTRLVLLAAGFPEPAANLHVRDPISGQSRYIDLAWEQIGLGVEYDGDGHRTTKDQWREDEARRDELASHGWTLVRATGEDIKHPRRLLLRLGRTMGERGLSVPSPERIGRFVAGLGEKRPSMQIGRHQPSA